MSGATTATLLTYILYLTARLLYPFVSPNRLHAIATRLEPTRAESTATQ
jgi:hypothetical protein